MSNPYFSFKQFTVHHELCAMKVGVDGVTLSAWVDVAGIYKILDIGTGSGLIALMLAQRAENAQITAIEIDGNAVIQAKTNVKNSPWKDRIEVIHNSLQDYSLRTTEVFDLIVCNPPYFVNSLKPEIEERSLARHSELLPHSDLIKESKKLLAENGRFCLILPVNEGGNFIRMAKAEGLFCVKKVFLHPNLQKPPKRLLIQLEKSEKKCEISELVIEKERGIYTPEYEQLVKDFYLKL